MTSRLDYIDEMKGLAIYFVCIGHFFGTHSIQGNLQPCSAIISSFHMALFFFLSGYVNAITNRIDSKGSLSYFRKKFLSLIIPHFFWVFIAPLFLYSWVPDNMGEISSKINFYPNINEWFLPCLFLAMMLWMITYNLSRRFSKLGGAFLFIPPLLLCLFGLIMSEYFLVIYAIYMGCFVFGHFLYVNSSLKDIVMKDWLWGVCALLLCIVWKLYLPSGGQGALLAIANLCLYAISSFGACICFYNFFRKKDYNRWIKRLLGFWGRMSIVIYLTPVYLLPKGYFFPEHWTLTMIVFFVCVLGFIQCMAAAFLGEIVFRIPYLRLFMYGKK